MHQENDRVRQAAAVENERLSTELETLKKEIAASQERMDREQKEIEAELAREKDRNNTLSEKLADATLVSERTMLAYGTQENLLKAKQEIIDTLKKESEAFAQPSKTVTMSHPVKEVETMTSNTDLTSESADMVPRSKVVELTDHYDAKIKVMSDDMEAKAELNRKTESALQAKDDLLAAKDEIIDGLKIIAEINKINATTPDDTGSTPVADEVTSNYEVQEKDTTQNGSIQECCEFIQIHAKHGVITNGLLLWADIKRKQHPEKIWKDEAVKKFTKQEITDAKEMLWRVSGEESIGEMTRRQGQSKTTSEMNDICAALKTLSEKDSIPMFLCTSGMIAETSLFESPQLTIRTKETEQLKHIDESIGSILKLISKEATPVSEDQQGTETRNTTAAFELGSPIPVTEMKESSHEEDNNNNKWRRAPGARRKRKPGLNEAELVISGVEKGVEGLQIVMELENHGIEIKDWELLTKRDDAPTLV